MRAVVTTDLGGPLQPVDLDDPTPAPGEVVVAVDGCGICGSDLHLVDALPMPGLVPGESALVIGGRVVVVGVCLAEDRYFPYGAMAKELDWRFAFYYCRADIDATVSAIHAGHLDVDPLITAEVGLDDAPAHFDALKAGTDDAKVLIRPSR